MEVTSQKPDVDLGLATCLVAAAKAQPTWLDALAFVGVLIVAIPSAAGNTLVAAVILRCKELRREAPYIVIVVLATIDLIHSYVAIYPLGGGVLLQKSVPSCEQRLITLNIIYLAWYATCISYTTVAVNRYMAICAAHWNKVIFSRRNIIVWACLLPFASLLILSPAISGKCCKFDFAPDLYLLRFEFGRDNEPNIQLWLCWIFSAQATLISCILYPIAFSRIKSLKSKIANKDQAGKQDGLQATNHGAGHVTSHVTSHGAKSSDVKLLVQFCALTGVYTFTWIVLHYEASRGADASKIMGYAAILGYSAMAGMNPLIYFSLNKTLRVAARGLWYDLKAGAVFRVCRAGGRHEVRNERHDPETTQFSTANSKLGTTPSGHHQASA